MKVLLDGLLPRLFPTAFCACRTRASSDLEKSIPRKLRAGASRASLRA